MKTLNQSMRTAAVLMILIFGTVVWAGTMGTAFTYQGRLLDNNVAADGLYDMRFKLYDDPNTLVGSQIGSTVTADDVDVVDGYFIAKLDFGSTDFHGDARWLEIAVRPFDSADPNDFVAQSPLQEITPAPYAVYAETSGSSAPDSDWVIDGNDIFSSVSGNVGIGTDNPGSLLSVGGEGYDFAAIFGRGGRYGVYGVPVFSGDGDGGVIGVTEYPPVGDYAYGILGYNYNTFLSHGVYGEHVGVSSGSLASSYGVGVTGTGNDVGVMGSGGTWGCKFYGTKNYFGGNVGIGTEDPATALDVAGTIKAYAINVPSVVVGNNFTGSFSGTFFGNGGALTDLTPGNIGPGTAGINISGNAATATSLAGDIDWSQIASRPAGLDDGDDVGLTVESDPSVIPSVKDGVSWSEIGSIPAGFADGIDNVGGIDSDWTVSGSDMYSAVSGNVGIGTTSPAYPLDIKFNSTGGYARIERNTNGGGGFRWNEVGESRAQWIFPFFRGWQSDNLIIRDDVANIDVMTFEHGTANVGIGINDPISSPPTGQTRCPRRYCR